MDTITSYPVLIGAVVDILVYVLARYGIKVDKDTLTGVVTTLLVVTAGVVTKFTRSKKNSVSVVPIPPKVP